MARSPKQAGKGKGPAIPQEHWEQHYDPTPRGHSDQSGIRCFDPIKSKDRPHTHVKINECDH